jgi:hypothetical protein
MSEISIDSSESNVRNWIALSAVSLAALAIAVLFSPAVGVYQLGGPQQITASLR